MAAVTLQSVLKQFGTQVVLEEVSLELQTGEVAGLVGSNGAGKTTLFRLIAGELTPEKGSITRSRGVGIGFLKQEPDVAPDRTLYDEVGGAFAEILALEQRLHAVSEQISACPDHDDLARLMNTYEHINAQFIAAGGHTFETRMNEVLGGLGFTLTDYALPMSALSGGQKCRASLAKVLLTGQGFLLLDEPTNHLDIDAVRWLEKFLTGHRGGAVIISHDRYLLDRLCDRIIELEHRKVTSFPGNYTNFARTKELRRLTQERQFEKDREFIEKERDFIAKHLAGQRTKEAQGRRTRLERRLKDGEFVTETPHMLRRAKFTFEKSQARVATAVRVDELAMAFGDNTLFTGLSFQMPAGERFGITGPNGTGKTTLLRIVLGELAPIGGSVTVAPKLSLGYYAQEHADLDPNRTVLEEVRAVRTELSEQQARTLLAGYLFSRDDVFKRLGQLSGGEQSRVRLATLILQSPDVLVLDEPTNHLDIPSREVLEAALLEFSGTIIVVSHDRYFLDRVVDRLLVLRREGHAIYQGNYSSYIQQVEQERAAGGVLKPFPSRRPARPRARRAGSDSRPKRGPSPYDRLSIDELETLIMQREAEIAALYARFGDPNLYRNADSLAELRAQADTLTEELAALDAAWQERVG